MEKHYIIASIHKSQDLLEWTLTPANRSGETGETIKTYPTEKEAEKVLEMKPKVTNEYWTILPVYGNF